MDTMTAIFGEPISVYTRAQALENGQLVDLTSWASSGPDGMLGGFSVPVAVTGALWGAIESIPKSQRHQDIRGRAHDVLWMGSLAARAMARDRVRDGYYKVILRSRGTRKSTRQLWINLGHDDAGAPCVTIGFPEDR